MKKNCLMIVLIVSILIMDLGSTIDIWAADVAFEIEEEQSVDETELDIVENNTTDNEAMEDIDEEQGNDNVFESSDDENDADLFSDTIEDEAVDVGAYGSNYRYWNQGQSNYANMRDAGCWIVAQAKLLYETGVDRSAGFNPDVLYQWELERNYIRSDCWQKGDGGIPPATYANQKGKNLEYLGNWNSDANQLWFNINAGYYTIVKLPGHYVYLDNEKSKVTGQLYCDDSSTTSPFYNTPQPLSSHGTPISCYVYKSNGNGGGSVDSGINTAWSEWEDNITETNACIYGKIDVGQRVQFTGAGVSIWNEAGSLIHQSSEGTSVNYNYMQISYNLQSELGVTLSPGQNYTYQMFADFGGKRYYGNKKTFKTTGQSNKVPIGNVDVIEGRDKAVYVKGWAFDPDNVNNSLSIDVYIGGIFVQRITADQERPDVEKAFFGVGNFHGFDAVIDTEVTGNQTVDVWALDTNSQGQNIKIGSGNVDITIDTERPEIKFSCDYVGDGIIAYKIEITDKSKTKVKFINDSSVYPYTIYETSYSMQKKHEFTFDTREISRKSTRDLWELKLIVEDEYGNESEYSRMEGCDVYDMTKLEHIVLVKDGNTYSMNNIISEENKWGKYYYTARQDIAKIKENNIVPVSTGATWLSVYNTWGQFISSYARIIEVVDKEKVCLNKEYAVLSTIGATLQLTADVTPINVKDKSVTWSSSDEKIATVSQNGLVTAKAKGVVDIVATSKINKVQAICRLNIKDIHQWTNWKIIKKSTVFEDGYSERICNECGKTESKKLAKLAPTGSLNMTSIPLKVKQKTTALKVSRLASGDYVKAYTSNNKKIFTVTKKGQITAIKAGNAVLTVTLASGKQLKAKVKVQKGTVKTSKVTVSERSKVLKKGKSYQIKALVSPLTSQEKVTYLTSNKKVATVSKNGKVVAKKKGKVVITVKSGKKNAKVKITVK